MTYLETIPADSGLITHIQRYTLHDGPGIRTMIFFKGCDLICPWCSNPESQNKIQEIGFDFHKCKNCGRCAEVCPTGAIQLDAKIRIDRNLCSLCGKCVRYCPNDAYKIYGQWMTVDELVESALKDRPFYEHSNGGITVSGGEATLQATFLEKFLKTCKSYQLHTALETHGAVAWPILQRLSQWLDLVLVDLKHMDNHKHLLGTGSDNAIILSNIYNLAFNENKKLALRIPLIPGYNDDDENIRQSIYFARSIQSSGNLTTVNILPYHNYGRSKYASLDKVYTMDDTPIPEKESIDRIVNQFIEAGLPCQEGG